MGTEKFQGGSTMVDAMSMNHNFVKIRTLIFERFLLLWEFFFRIAHGFMTIWYIG